jgi:hypothetical protein
MYPSRKSRLQLTQMHLIQQRLTHSRPRLTVGRLTASHQQTASELTCSPQSRAVSARNSGAARPGSEIARQKLHARPKGGQRSCLTTFPPPRRPT